MQGQLDAVQAGAEETERLLKAQYQYYGASGGAQHSGGDVEQLREELMVARKARLQAEAALDQASDGTMERDPEPERRARAASAALAAQRTESERIAAEQLEDERLARQAQQEAEVLASMISTPEGELVSFNLVLLCSLENWLHNIHARAAAVQSLATMLELPEPAIGITGFCGTGAAALRLSVSVSLQSVSSQQLTTRLWHLEQAATARQLFMGGWPVISLVLVEATPRPKLPIVPKLQLQGLGLHMETPPPLPRRSTPRSSTPTPRSPTSEIASIERELAELQAQEDNPQLPSPIKRLQTLQESLLSGQTSSIRTMRETLTKVHTPRAMQQEEESLLDERHLQVLNSPREPLPRLHFTPNFGPKNVRFAHTNHMRIF
eukprot:TRINITY_DN8522_c0_g3_i1.p1 TRINITY_DN8522_c0_g3~~TRINITY_DN8522_c0_g3_i1.p1  ORF type:complete len:379 (+),score=100.44 TRINITY_DN8522_c0_g3_i1:58-1194(+)